MQNINTVTITGNLTHAPKLRNTEAGTPVCGLRVAVNGRRRTADGSYLDTVDYVNISVWGRRGEACAEHLAKGRPVAVSGRLDWHAAGEGDERREYLQIVADTVQFLGRRPQEAEAGETPTEEAGQESLPEAEPVAA